MYYLFVAKDLHITAYIGKKQFTTDFMEYLVSLSLNEFDIKYFSK